MSGCNTNNQLSPKQALERLGKDDRGIALLTVMLIMLMLTVMGVAAMTVSSVENNIAGIQRTTEAAGTAAESCLGTGVNIIQQTIMAGSLPAALAPPVTNAANLNREIMGQSDNNSDQPAQGSANVQLSAGAFTVYGDIDRLYAKPMSGGSQVFAGAYEGYGQGAGAGGIEIYYRISCVAQNIALGTTSHTTAVYACVTAGEGCQRKL